MSAEILIDTHFVVWLRTEPQELTIAERAALDSATRIWISAVSLWEIAMLLPRSRIRHGDVRLLDLPAWADWLPVTTDHCKTLTALPRLHRDPFDRMLVAQAQRDGLALMTRDQAIQAYGRFVTILP